ncbi:MAG: hypothetical protein RLZZ224_1630 [Verrucomicrobiota bacterium]
MLALTGIYLIRGNLDQIFGVPPTPIGERLYSDFTPQEITQIDLSSNDARASFTRVNGVWMMTSPVKDRMDPRWAKTLIDFTLSTRAADVIPNEKIDNTQAGLTDGMISVRLGDAQGKARARFIVGRRTGWRHFDADTQETVPTIFLQPRDRSRKSHIYACTGDIRAIFKESFRFFRDHQPFLFAPSQLEKIHVKSAASEFVLEGHGARVPWRITKPQKLATEAQEMKKLIESGLFSLRAIRLIDRAKINLPTNQDAVDLSITLHCHGHEQPVTLLVYPPADDKATTVFATVSDRPGTVFELPLRPYPDLVSLSELPLRNYNELRSQKLIDLDQKNLKAIDILPRQQEEIHLQRPPRGIWQLHPIDAPPMDLNEAALYQFLKIIKEAKVAGFITDSAFLTEDAQELVTYGLHEPQLTLRFVSQRDEVTQLRFGITKEGSLCAHCDTPDTKNTIVKMPDDFLSRLPLRTRQWKDTRLLAIAPMDFVNLERTLPNQAPLQLSYRDRDETWEATQNGENISGKINPSRAAKLLEVLGDLRVNRWISATDSDALQALEKPAMTMKLICRQLNAFGESTGLSNKTLEITPVSQQGTSQFFYGRFSDTSELFVIDRRTALLLALDLFAESD